MGCSCSNGHKSTHTESNDFLSEIRCQYIADKRIPRLTHGETNDFVTLIEKVKVPMFKNKPLQIIANVARLTGNSPYHVGLIFHTLFNRLFIAQSYPITFQVVYDMRSAINKIISYNSTNKASNIVIICREKYVPRSNITIKEVRDLVERQPNEYHIITQNCQDFSNNILRNLDLEVVNDEDDKVYEEFECAYINEEQG